MCACAYFLGKSSIHIYVLIVCVFPIDGDNVELECVSSTLTCIVWSNSVLSWKFPVINDQNCDDGNNQQIKFSKMDEIGTNIANNFCGVEYSALLIKNNQSAIMSMLSYQHDLLPSGTVIKCLGVDAEEAVCVVHSDMAK